MELLTQSIINKLKKHPIYSQDNKREKKIIVKYFTPWSSWTWYIVEGEQQGDDWLLFGYVISGLGEDCNEWGYVSLNELKSITGPMGLKIERDLYFGEHTINIEGRVK